MTSLNTRGNLQKVKNMVRAYSMRKTELPYLQMKVLIIGNH